MPRSINRNAASHRSTLRLFGTVLVVVGGVFAAIGIGSFFVSFGSGPSEYFWCAFVGIPLLGIGMRMLKFGYIGAVSRYVAGEIAPVANDTIDYVARGSRRAVRDVARAASEGMRGRDEDPEQARASVRDRLVRLDALRKDGLIDADEYEEQKDRILGDL